MKKIASIDIGSNTVRLLILEYDENQKFQTLASRRVITRLGEGMDVYGKLIESRISATISALSTFRNDCRKNGNPPLHAVARGAVLPVRVGVVNGFLMRGSRTHPSSAS